MKKLTLFSVLAVLFAALSFTSCNSSDDSYSYLTKEQQDSYQTTISLGNYSDMMLHFSSKNDADINHQTDSVQVSCSVSMYKDSTITMTNFPIAKMAQHITDADLKAAIAEEAPRNIKCKYMVLPESTNATAYFYIRPESLTMNLNVGGTTKEVTFVFSTATGVCNLTTKQMAFQFYLYQIWVDKKQTSYLQNSTSTQYTSVPFLCQPRYTK